jgi:5-methylcytosine-specific restriction protein A
MPTITTKMIQAVYEAAKSVYHALKNRKDVLDELENYYGMKRGSASDYIANFKKMMDGKCYTRTNNVEATEYFFESILLDYGPTKLSNALQAARKHVNYYSNLSNGGNLKKVSRLIEKYQTKVDISQPCIPEEISEEENYFEGGKKQITVNAYERNPQARAKCIAHHGLDCKVCGFNFAEVYGEIGQDYIHVHHIKPLSEIQEGYQVNPINDLVPVCPNCHAMLHKKIPSYTVHQIKQYIKLSDLKIG